jgi:hypothetical protein
MALLTPPDILPEAMRFLVRALLAVKGTEVDKDELVDLVAPRGLVEAMDSVGTDAEAMPGEDSDLRTGGNVIASASFDALRLLGVVEQQSSGVGLTKAIPERWKRPADVTPKNFSQFLLGTVMQLADPDAPLVGSQGVMDLVRALVLLHVSEEPLRPFDRFEPTAGDSPRSGRNFIDTQQAAFGTDRQSWPVTNRERWLPFCRWSCYLGLARPWGGTGLIPDASQALAAQLQDLESGDYDIRDFVTRCASVVPILDGGRLHSGHDPRLEGDHAFLSAGLSVTLLQLEADGLLVMDKRSDTGGRTLRLRPDGSADRLVTTVVWTRKRSTRRGGR